VRRGIQMKHPLKEKVFEKKNKYKEFADQTHLLVHALRLIPNYKPSDAELKLSKWISELYASECLECKAKNEYYKTLPEQKKKAKFMDRINYALEGTEE
jgi:hypothetical protein